MSNIVLSFKFTGENMEELTPVLEMIIGQLRTQGHDVYCSIEDEVWFREREWTNGEIMERAFEKIDASDILFAFVRSEERSEGMLVEIGYALAKGKRLVLAIKEGVNTTSLKDLAAAIIEFVDTDDLIKKLPDAMMG
jgi:nucleoside 2-deoxyribosyltransferase